jgi:hypothetical protein
LWLRLEPLFSKGSCGCKGKRSFRGNVFVFITIWLISPKKLIHIPNLCTTTTLDTWKTWSLCRRKSEKVESEIQADTSGRPLLLTGGCCLEVVVKTCLTLLGKVLLRFMKD